MVARTKIANSPSQIHAAAENLMKTASRPTDRLLLDRLRQATHSRHVALERDLALLSPVLSPDRLRVLLERFFGFFAVWEDAVARAFDDERFFAPRRKLHLLAADLRRFGLSEAEVRALPVCKSAASLARDLDSGLGSLYVLEGATLGGRLIDRHLKALGWTPGPSLAFFNPYGSVTGAMWMAFCVRAENRASPGRNPGIVDAAVETFDLVQQWLEPAFARNHRVTA